MPVLENSLYFLTVFVCFGCVCGCRPRDNMCYYLCKIPWVRLFPPSFYFPVLVIVWFIKFRAFCFLHMTSVTVVTSQDVLEMTFHRKEYTVFVGKLLYCIIDGKKYTVFVGKL